MESGLRLCLVLASLLGGGMAQTITARNFTAADAGFENDNAIKLAVSRDGDMVPLAAVLPLTQGAKYTPPPGLSGPAILANYTNQVSIQPDNVAVLSCDNSAYAGNIDALDVFGTAETVNATGILWYSTQADYCDLEQYTGSYVWVYTMKSVNDTRMMLDNINTLSENRGGTVYLTIGQPASVAQASNGSTSNGNGPSQTSGQQNQNSNPLGPSPSTAVAMIILYSITGVITALFLVIIITGAVRAHRHPERYGPRNIMGRPRQSRARGIAMAMLETIPIVKFGDRDSPKPTDVELADTDNAHTDASGSHPPVEHSVPVASGARDSASAERAPAEEGRPSVSGIAPAANSGPEEPDADNQGCSICTEDFEIGQDQRVLPCNHRFHPACIDPWLLNVSGTCPLCRIDLRPQTSRSEAELDEHGNPVPRDGDEMAPPLAIEGDANRMSVRRSLMLGLMGVGRPDRMTREERVLALRQYRSQQAVRRRRSEQVALPETPQTQEEERSLRSRLRSAFRIRTRRTEPENAATQAAGPPDAGVDDREATDTRQGGPSNVLVGVAASMGRGMAYGAT